MGVVNRAAAPGDRIASAGGHLTAAPFARQDIFVDDIVTDSSDAQFALACRRDVNRATFYPEMVVLQEIRVEGALLAVVKHRADAP
jgi:hypothetical protein